jgi:protein SCO1/2
VSAQAPNETTTSSPDAATVPPGEPPTGEAGAHAAPPPRGRSRGWMLPALVALVVLAGLTVLLIGGSTKPQLPGGANSAQAAGFDGGVLNPRLQAPSLGGLHNYLGQPVSLASYRGKAVFVTFLYTHCPDACPLIAASLHAALGEMGPLSKRVQLIAVSVDPRGDTPRTVAAFLKEHGLVGRMLYLIGNGKQLAPVWSGWKVGAAQDVNNPEVINHTALVYGVSASGKLLAS